MIHRLSSLIHFRSVTESSHILGIHPLHLTQVVLKHADMLQTEAAATGGVHHEIPTDTSTSSTHLRRCPEWTMPSESSQVPTLDPWLYLFHGHISESRRIIRAAQTGHTGIATSNICALSHSGSDNLLRKPIAKKKYHRLLANPRIDMPTGFCTFSSIIHFPD